MPVQQYEDSQQMFNMCSTNVEHQFNKSQQRKGKESKVNIKYILGMKFRKVYQFKAHEYKFEQQNVEKLNQQIIAICEYLCYKNLLDPEEDIKISYGHNDDDYCKNLRTVSIHQFNELNLN